MPTVFRSGFVALIGRPNAGKSTLVNAALGRKLLITSQTAQTTRHRFRAILDGEGYQLVLVDTPGIHKPHDLLGEELNSTAAKSIEDVDAIAFVVDSSEPIGKGDEWVAAIIRKSHVPCILVLSKSDLVGPGELAAQEENARQLLDFSDVVALSALEGKNIGAFVEAAVRHLPHGPCWFPPGTGCDQPLEVVIAEFIREKVLRSTFDEVPHSVGVAVTELEYQKKGGLYRIFATLYVERESQKGIIVGKGGQQIKSIGTEARADLEHFLSARVYLDLRVKLRRGWRKDKASIRRFGYGDMPQ
jgi:GTP-binding protein Era